MESRNPVFRTTASFPKCGEHHPLEILGPASLARDVWRSPTLPSMSSVHSSRGRFHFRLF